MSGRQPTSHKTRDRLDHILPQGYLAGFTNPTHVGNLHVYDCRRSRWFQSGAARVSASKGFYDLLPDSGGFLSADRTFEPLESRFPEVRRELIAREFSGWETHLDFLLTFGQMLRARSRLYREQKIAEGQRLPMGRVDRVSEVPSATRPGEIDHQIHYTPITDPKEKETLAKQKSIMDMCNEIAKGADWLARLKWSLWRAPAVTNPLVTGDDAIVVFGRIAQPGEFYDPTTRVIFPLSWQACLIGSYVPCAYSVGELRPAEVRQTQAFYLRGRHFAYSPIELRLT